MSDVPMLGAERARSLIDRAATIGTSRRTRKIGIIIVAIVLVLGIATFFAVPAVLRNVLTGRVAATIHRPVTVGDIYFNLYTLRLRVDRLHVGNRMGSDPFVDLGSLNVRVSWSSLFHLAPIVKEVTVESPSIHLVRESDGQFNFSDLMKSSTPSPPPAPAKPSEPLKFAVSNILVNQGKVEFDDKLMGQKHSIERIRLGIPFIANFNADLDVVVQPLLQMLVDGSPILILGETKPFGTTLDSVIDLRLHALDLPRYMAYAPKTVKAKMPSGALSMDVLVHFIRGDNGPVIRANGAVSLDQLDVRDANDAPVLGLDHLEVRMNDVEPLARVAYLDSIRVDDLKANLVRNHDGTTNLAGLMASPPPSAPTPAAVPSPTVAARPVAAPTIAAPSIAVAAPPIAATPQATPAAGAQQFDASINSFEMVGSSVTITDLSAAKPSVLELDAIHTSINNLRTQGQIPATYEIAATVHTGGTLDVKGSVDVVKQNVTTTITAEKIDLHGLQNFAQSVLAGSLDSGKFTAHATVQAGPSGGVFNVHAAPADVALDNFAVSGPRDKEPPIAWSHFGITLDQFDLGQHLIAVKEVSGDGIKVFVQRDRNGKLSLMSLMRQAEPPPREARRRERRRLEPRERRRAEPRERHRETETVAAPPVTPKWQYTVESVAIEKTDARVEDRSLGTLVRLELSPLNINLKKISSDFSKPIDIAVDGTLNRRGTFKIDGNAAIDPLKANLNIVTNRLDVSAAGAYASTKLNAVVRRVALTTKSIVAVAKDGKDLKIKYGGDVTVGDLYVLDKVTGDEFLKWEALSLRRIDADIGGGPPKVHVGGIALDNFYARIILNSTGKLNLSDVLANPQQAPKSLTRAEGEPGATPVAPPIPTPQALPSPAAAAPPPPPQAHPIDADLRVGGITLAKGKVDYTDDFIKPNYSADLSDIGGKVGAFGTKSSEPADVELQGQVNGSAPLNISGSINPLAPLASVDIKANAQAIELTGLTPYTTKYTGYPIEKGTLTVDVHYLLNQGQLKAENHILLDQLTFGDRVQNSTARNLPIRLAVAILKDSQGKINLSIPVSGSLSDPQFSIGSVVWSAFENIVLKAITSPFSLLASAVGSVGGKNADLSYVAFDAGRSKLTPDTESQLTAIATALQQRPSLSVNISGRVDPKLDRPGLQVAKVDDAIEAQADKSRHGRDENQPLTPAEHDKYLKRAYSAADFPKPRDAVGLAKSLPPAEMQKLMVTNTKVTGADLQQLADARANAVRKFLATKVPVSRLFVVAPKLNADDVKQGTTTRADLSLQ
jgi:Domain of Unknown Function (DUF748)